MIEFLKEIPPILQLILGGLLTLLGGIIGIWFQTKFTKRTRMDQVIAEKAVDASNEAYIHMKDLEARLVQDTLENTLAKVLEREKWLIKSRLFLPGKFPDNWFKIRNKLSKAVRLNQQISKGGTQQEIDKLEGLEKQLRTLVEKAILEIYKAMNKKRIKV